MRKVLRTFLCGLLGTYPPYAESAKRAAAMAFIYAETDRRLREQGVQTVDLFKRRMSNEEIEHLLPKRK